MTRAKRIEQLLADEDFRAVVAVVEQRLTRKVMGQTTEDEDRRQALAQYHGLQILLGALRSEAQNVNVKEQT